MSERRYKPSLRARKLVYSQCSACGVKMSSKLACASIHCGIPLGNYLAAESFFLPSRVVLESVKLVSYSRQFACMDLHDFILSLIMKYTKLF